MPEFTEQGFTELAGKVEELQQQLTDLTKKKEEDDVQKSIDNYFKEM